MPIVSRKPSPLPTGWGIVSTGHIAKAFAADLAYAERPDIVAVCSRSLETAERFAQSHSGATRTGKLRSVRAYDRLEEMVADPAVEMIYVASLNVAHVEATRIALEAGKPVLCEKPMAMTADEAQALADLARERGVFLMEGLWTRHLPAVQAAKALVEVGAIGEVHSVEASLHADRPYDPRSRLFDPAQGGGALHDLGVYPLSIAIQYTGPPADVNGRWWRAESNVDGRAEVQLRGNGVEARVTCGFDAGPNGAVIRGTGGTLVLDSALRAISVTQYRPGIEPPPTEGVAGKLREWWVSSSGGAVRRDHSFEGSGLRFQAVRMAECIRDGLIEAPEAPLNDTIAALRTIDTVLATEPVGAV